MKINTKIISAILIFSALEAGNDTDSSMHKLRRSKDFVLQKSEPGVKIDLKYATTDNFLKQNLYGSFNECYLHAEAMKKLHEARKLLADRKPGYGFLVFDCLRPRSVQRRLWTKVKGTDKQAYVADPDKGSLHNYGFAIDLTITDALGKELDMGTRFDSFSKKSEPRLEDKFVASGELTPEQLANRKFLRAIMTGAGFSQQVNEWWHYNAVSAKTLRSKKYVIFE